MSNIKLNKRGFTLIEVVLVLAIGGLIFLLAFLAFQQASINRRDTQRRSDAGRMVAELQNYQADKGTLPSSSLSADSCTSTTTFGTFMGTYLCKDLTLGSVTTKVFLSPQNTNYTYVSGTGALSTNQIRFVNNTNCSGGTGFKVEIGLEKGSVCRDDQ